MRGNIQPNGTHSNNHNKNTTQRKKKIAQGKIKGAVLLQINFNVNNENAIKLEYFNLRTHAVSTSEQMPEDGQIRPKHVAL
jgi:hypothetical protein